MHSATLGMNTRRRGYGLSWRTCSSAPTQAYLARLLPLKLYSKLIYGTERQEDKVFRAASDAHKASGMVLGLHPKFARQVEVVPALSPTQGNDALARPAPDVAV